MKQSTPFNPAERNLLLWCQSHDWGTDSTLTDDGRIAGLRDVMVLSDGTVQVSIISLPADRATLRCWAGY